MNNKKLSVPVIVISVFVLLSTFFLVMEIISIKTVIDNINRTEEEIQDLNEKLIYLKGFEKNMEEMLKNLDKLKALPGSLK